MAKTTLLFLDSWERGRLAARRSPLTSRRSPLTARRSREKVARPPAARAFCPHTRRSLWQKRHFCFWQPMMD
jgi:hypothetical protein